MQGAQVAHECLKAVSIMKPICANKQHGLSPGKDSMVELQLLNLPYTV